MGNKINRKIEILNTLWNFMKDNLEREIVHAQYHGRKNQEKAARDNLNKFPEIIESIISSLIPIPEDKLNEFVKKHSRHMTLNTYYDNDDQKQGKTPTLEYPRVQNALKQMLKEYDELKESNK